jgi:hypothetical protein
MGLPSTKPLDGLFWYVLDENGNLVWRPCPKLRGDFYLGWLGQDKNVLGAGLVHMEEGEITHMCTHGTPYYWLQPYEALPVTSETMRAQEVRGAETMALDFSLAGWGFREHTSPAAPFWPEAPIPVAELEPLLPRAVSLIVRNFRSAGEPPSKPTETGLLARAESPEPADPLDELLRLLKEDLGESNVVPVLIELVRHDINVIPSFRQSDFFETLPPDEEWPASSKVARLVLSAIYHLAPLLGSRRLNGMLLLNSLRQRHPFDVTWGADFLVKCYGMSSLVRLLLAAVQKEQNDQVRGNVLDLVQELGYGCSVGLGPEISRNFADLQGHADVGAFGQVVSSHLTFIQEYLLQRDAAAHVAG